MSGPVGLEHEARRSIGVGVFQPAKNDVGTVVTKAGAVGKSSVGCRKGNPAGRKAIAQNDFFSSHTGRDREVQLVGQKFDARPPNIVQGTAVNSKVLYWRLRSPREDAATPWI